MAQSSYKPSVLISTPLLLQQGHVCLSTIVPLEAMPGDVTCYIARPNISSESYTITNQPYGQRLYVTLHAPSIAPHLCVTFIVFLILPPCHPPYHTTMLLLTYFRESQFMNFKTHKTTFMNSKNHKMQFMKLMSINCHSWTQIYLINDAHQFLLTLNHNTPLMINYETN